MTQSSEATTFIILFTDSMTWNRDSLGSNTSVVIPEQDCDQEQLTRFLDEDTGWSDVQFPMIPISKMIRELQDAGRWDKLVADAKEEANA